MKEVIWNLLSKGTKRGGKSCLEIDSSVIVAILSLLGTGIGSVLGVVSSGKVVNEKINTMQKAIDKHNSVIERTYSLERDVKTAYNLIDTLREKDDKFEKTVEIIQNSLNEMKLELAEIRAKTDLIEKREIDNK